MTLTRGRVVKGAADAEAVGPRAGGTPRGRVVRREVLDAEARAAAIVAEAERTARELVEAGRRESADVRLRAEAEARADGAAAVAAQMVAIKQIEAESDERQLDRIVAVAQVLAERLLGEQLTLAPERVSALARQALREARGARQVRIVAHPSDAEQLELGLDSLGLLPGTVSVVADPGRARHALRFETDIGVLDAELAPQLQRLALKLRESLSR